MRRLKLSQKMLVAALPLVIAVAALLALTVRSDLDDISSAENGAELGAIWQPLTAALTAIENEADPTMASDTAARRATDAAINELRDEAAQLGAAEAAGDHITASRSALSAARRNLDMVTIAPDLQVEIDPLDAYAQASRELVSVGQLLPSEAGDPQLGRELLAVVKLAEAKLAADIILHDVATWQADPSDLTPLSSARNQFAELEAVLGEFEAIAPEDWQATFRESGFTPAIARERSNLDSVIRSAQAGENPTYDPTDFAQLVEGGVVYQVQVADSIVERADAEAAATRSDTLRRTGLVVAVGAVAVLLAWLIARSITKRIKAVAKGANQVTTEQLPALVTAINDPKGKGKLPEIDPIPTKGNDELNELAESFNSLQDTLVDVAQEQVEVLRRGVSDIFVTMARRNRSLIDRQLAMLDEFEAEVDDPEVLANYYQLDHMATRMRRNSESLLVLANAEPKRRRVKATEVDDVVRAAIGEVEDYRRIEIEALESLQVRGNVVADISHLLAELLDNATSFSPPDSYVRVGGRLTEKGYMIRILDGGVGIGTERLKQLNELLREPPVVGLSVESTLGMSVVSLLANKHSITVTLAPGNPGLIVDVLIPPALFGPIDADQPMPTAAAAAATAAPAAGDVPTLDAAMVPTPDAAEIERMVAWDDTTGAPVDETFEPAEPLEPVVQESAPVAEPMNDTPSAVYDPDDERPVAAADWRAMSLNLAAFQSGMAAANGSQDETEAAVTNEIDTVQPTETDETFVAAVDEAPVTDGIAGSSADVANDADVAETPSIPAGTPGSGVDGNGGNVDLPGDLPTRESEATEPAPAPMLGGLDIADLAAQVGAEESAEAPAPQLGGLTFDAPTLPPPTAAPTGEFDVPPAPPNTAMSPSQRPVAPTTAQRAPEPAPRDLAPSLPTRTPGQGPDGGPDRLAASLDAAADSQSNGSLPTRTRVGDPVAPVEEPLATTAGGNPDALRDRLRAFQTEFRSALGTDSITDDRPSGHDHPDLGGDR